MPNQFQSESPRNLLEKCLCVLVMDVSGTMNPHMPVLNQSLTEFFRHIETDNGLPEGTKDQLEICIEQFDYEHKFRRNPCLLNPGEVPPTLSTRQGTTESVDALNAAIKMVEDRKAFYKNTGQPYYRPWIIFVTDGEPNPFREDEIAAFEAKVTQDVAKKKYMIMGLGVGDDITQKTLLRLTAGKAHKLKGTNFGSFFKWLSNSLGVVASSKPGQKVDLSPGASQWMTSFSI